MGWCAASFFLTSSFFLNWRYLLPLPTSLLYGKNHPRAPSCRSQQTLHPDLLVARSTFKVPSETLLLVCSFQLFTCHLCFLLFCPTYGNAGVFYPGHTSALLTTPKPLTVWITTNCGKFFKRREYQTTWPASWEICMQIKKQELELLEFPFSQIVPPSPSPSESKSPLYTSVLLYKFFQFLLRETCWSYTWVQ